MSLGTMGPVRDLGPAIPAWGATQIDETWEEIRLTLNSADAGEVFECIHGGTPVDTIVSGYSECSVIVPATRILLSTLALLLPGGSNSGGVTGGGAGIVRINPSIVTGRSMYDEGLPLIIKPIIAGVASANGFWMRLERTYPQPVFDTIFNLRDQRVYGIKFKAHPDADSGLLWSAGYVAEGTSY